MLDEMLDQIQLYRALLMAAYDQLDKDCPLKDDIIRALRPTAKITEEDIAWAYAQLKSVDK